MRVKQQTLHDDLQSLFFVSAGYKTLFLKINTQKQPQNTLKTSKRQLRFYKP